MNDVVIGISTSGNSKNIVKGLEMSKEKGAKTISLLGNSGGTIKNYSDIAIIVDSDVTRSYSRGPSSYLSYYL